MATPQFGTYAILPTGNSKYGTNAGPPAIDSRVFVGGFGGILPPPTMNFPRMPMIERLTPRTMNAQQQLSLRTLQARSMIVRRREQVKTLIMGYANAWTMRR
jgi:hypothetical protein